MKVTFQYPKQKGHKCTPGMSVPVTFVATDACGNVESQTRNITFTAPAKRSRGGTPSAP